MMTIRYDYDMKVDENDVRMNCYSRSIYEYDINVNHIGWKDFYEKLCDVSDEYLDNQSHDDLINYLYQLVDDNALKYLEKKSVFRRPMALKGRYL